MKNLSIICIKKLNNMKRGSTMINYNEKEKIFYLANNEISYIMSIMKNNQIGQVYFGKKIKNSSFNHLDENMHRPMSAYPYEGDLYFSLEQQKQEYPSYGTSDFRRPAFEIKQENGSRLTNFQYVSHKIYNGKPQLNGLPATYTENENEAETLEILLHDSNMDTDIILMYTIFAEYNAVARSVKFINKGEQNLFLTNTMSSSLDLPDYDFEWIQLSGAWSRERHIKTRKLEQGIQSISSSRGHSSHNHNPFIALKRPSADEFSGEVYGFSLVYSGNFIIQTEVDVYGVSRTITGINPDEFEWNLKSGETFQTPEAVMVYSDKGLNGMSQTYHKLYRTRLARGEWRDKARPILINNWEATYFDYDEDKLVEIAQTAKNCGIELFVLDDGWFGTRSSDHEGLGDWFVNTDKLKNGISGLSERIEEIGMKFGLWIEPEMVNKKSKLYTEHPDWILHNPEHTPSHGRNQYVLDFSRQEVVDNIFNQISEILRTSKISYIKWDMNRSITECYSIAYPPSQQGEIFHRYILGVYSLYERFIKEFPHILFESCASGGGRFDAGMLYYAPQAWASDDTDAIERQKIQYGTSLCYPISSIGAHVSAVPNHQVGRLTHITERANTAYFGTFGYELDLNKLSSTGIDMVKEQVKFFKEYRELIQKGTFYRLLSPFEGNFTAWAVISEDKKTVIAGVYRILSEANGAYRRIRLHGINADYKYSVEGGKSKYYAYGDELMNYGMITSDYSAGEVKDDSPRCRDFESRIFILKAD